jgi:vancomycin permeability regulator SanA
LGQKLTYLAVVLLLVLVAVAALFVVTYRTIDQRSGRDESRPADVILVLGSAVWPNEQPSPSLRARTQRAIELYQEGYAPYLLLSGGLGRYPPEEAEVMRRLAVDAGIPQEALFLDKEAHSTWESVQNAREIMEQQGWETAIVVSDPFHIYRSLLMAEDAGIQAYGAPALESTTYTVPMRRAFYTSREVLALWWYLLQRTLNPG